MYRMRQPDTNRRRDDDRDDDNDRNYSGTKPNSRRGESGIDLKDDRGYDGRNNY